MSDVGVEESLGKKVGPLPLGAWVAVVAAGLGIGWYMRRNQAAAAAVPAVPDTSTWNQGGDVSTQPGVGGSVAQSIPAPPAAPATNDEWLRRASDALLIANLAASPATINYALTQWMSGVSLTEQQRAIVDQAIRLIGNPPSAPPPPTNAPPVTPTKPPPVVKPPAPMPNQPAYWIHTRIPGETLERVALFYNTQGRSPGITVQDLWNANKKGIRRLNGSAGVLTSYEIPHTAPLVIPTNRKKLTL